MDLTQNFNNEAPEELQDLVNAARGIVTVRREVPSELQNVVNAARGIVPT